MKCEKFHLKIKLLYSEEGQTLERVTQSSCGVSILGDNQRPGWTWPWATCCRWPEQQGWTKLSPEVPSSLSSSVLCVILWLLRLNQINDLEFNSYCYVSKVVPVMWQQFELFYIQAYGYSSRKRYCDLWCNSLPVSVECIKNCSDAPLLHK